jgi:hypothetical protein
MLDRPYAKFWFGLYRHDIRRPMKPLVSYIRVSTSQEPHEPRSVGNAVADIAPLKDLKSLTSLNLSIGDYLRYQGEGEKRQKRA